MIYADLIKQVARATGNSQNSTKEVLDELFASLQYLLIHGDSIYTPAGVFKTVERRGGSAYNFQTGEKIVIPPHKVVKFSPNSTFKKNVR